MRSAFKDRIDGLARAVQGGIYSPNEARALESLSAAEDGDEPRVQQQVVPLSAWDKQPPAPAGGNGGGKTGNGAADGDGADPEDAADSASDANPDEQKALAKFLLQRAMDRHAA